MKATGIVRRIDDLGRVVIPKEIRRTMRIREGDPLEIYTGVGGEVVFKKYSVMGEIAESAAAICEAISKNTSFAVLICDRDHCVSAAGLPKKEVLERPITPELSALIEERHAARFDKEKGFLALEGVNRAVKFAVPIISAGDITGAVVLIEGEGEYPLEECDMKLASMSALFLGRQTE